MVSSKTNPDLKDSDTRLQLLCFETWRWSNCSQSFQGSMTNKPWFNSPHSVSYPCQQVLHVMYHSSCRTYIILLIRVKGNTCGIFFRHLNSSERILSFFRLRAKNLNMLCMYTSSLWPQSVYCYHRNILCGLKSVKTVERQHDEGLFSPTVTEVFDCSSVKQ